MTNNAMVFRTEESLAHASDVIDQLTEEYEEVSIDDKGEVFNYDLTEALELGYLSSWPRSPWPVPGPAPRAAAPTSATTTRCGRTSTG